MQNTKVDIFSNKIIGLNGGNEFSERARDLGNALRRDGNPLTIAEINKNVRKKARKIGNFATLVEGVALSAIFTGSIPFTSKYIPSLHVVDLSTNINATLFVGGVALAAVACWLKHDSKVMLRNLKAVMNHLRQY
jgi:hypothetical protein